jgi:hypothetical protein
MDNIINWLFQTKTIERHNNFYITVLSIGLVVVIIKLLKIKYTKRK